jgi:hypothetical protein
VACADDSNNRMNALLHAGAAAASSAWRVAASIEARPDSTAPWWAARLGPVCAATIAAFNWVRPGGSFVARGADCSQLINPEPAFKKVSPCGQQPLVAIRAGF